LDIITGNNHEWSEQAPEETGHMAVPGCQLLFFTIGCSSSRWSTTLTDFPISSVNTPLEKLRKWKIHRNPEKLVLPEPFVGGFMGLYFDVSSR
jgi:hypothetical protein